MLEEGFCYASKVFLVLYSYPPPTLNTVQLVGLRVAGFWVRVSGRLGLR